LALLKDFAGIINTTGFPTQHVSLSFSVYLIDTLIAAKKKEIRN